jgi:hypothetical protein
MSRMVELLGVLGGSAGFFYAMGYLVLAGHSRVLGLPLRSTDATTLLISAWEFFVQGTLFTVLRTLQALSPLVSWSGIAATATGAIAFALLHKNTALRTKWSRAAARHIDGHPIVFALSIAMVVLAVQGFHIAAHVVPSTSVTSLLSAPNPVFSPFPPMRPALRDFFDRHWNEARRSIVGNGLQSDSRTLSGLFVVHVLITAATSVVAGWLWWWARRRKLPRLLKGFSAVVVLCSAFLWIYTPLYYGVTMKSYRYPLVRLTPADGKGGSLVTAEFKQTSLHPRFLLQTTDTDYVFYDARFREIHVVKRDLVGIVKLMTDDFLFTETSQ